MKKLLLLITLLLLFTGCSYYNINKQNTDSLVENILKEKANNTNTAFKGYKVYIPSSMNLIDDYNNNNIIYSNENKYYLYVDLISYYKNVNNKYKINENRVPFYSKIIKYGNKSGYILVTKLDNEYFTQIMYNYSKIEVISKNYKEAIAKSLIILKSVTFNDKIIETLIGSNILQYDEEEFNLLGPSAETVDFLKEYEDVDKELTEVEKKQEQELKINDDED